jgi:hypothetical protein
VENRPIETADRSEINADILTAEDKIIAIPMLNDTDGHSIEPAHKKYNV